MKTFEQIKKKSESYAKLMRDCFPDSFEKGELNSFLDNMVFDDEKSFFVEDLITQDKKALFIDYVLASVSTEETTKQTSKTIRDLLSEVGYEFFICKTVDDVNEFKKHYKPGEELCTFNDIQSRLSKYHIFWIVKKDIAKIKHQGDKRNRQDDYGTSCCSIQINKKNHNNISIKNRYNHQVSNCDATFSNNLDNISQGLSYAFSEELGIKTKKQKSVFEMNKRYSVGDKIFYYNHEINNIYYGVNKVYKKGEFVFFDKTKERLVDYFVFDFVKKEVRLFDTSIKDAFIEACAGIVSMNIDGDSIIMK